MPKDGARQLELFPEKEQQVETYYGVRIDEMTPEEARAALRHCIREMHVREREEDELWRKWERLGFPKRHDNKRPLSTGNPTAALYKIREP